MPYGTYFTSHDVLMWSVGAVADGTTFRSTRSVARKTTECVVSEHDTPVVPEIVQVRVVSAMVAVVAPLRTVNV